MKTRPLLSDAVIQAAHYAHEKYLSKFYRIEDNLFPSDHADNLKFKKTDGTIVKIPRANHGIAHSISVAAYIPLVIEFLKKHGKKDNAFIQKINTLDDYVIECLQIAAVFSVTGRLDETGGDLRNRRIGKRYRQYREASANFFKGYAESIGMHTYNVTYWSSVVREMGNTPYYMDDFKIMKEMQDVFPIPKQEPHIVDVILHFAHCLDLFRCKDFTKEKHNPLELLKDFSDTTNLDFEKDYIELLQFACNLILQRGDRLLCYMDNDGAIKKLYVQYRENFCETNMKVSSAMGAVNYAEQYNVFSVAEKIDENFKDVEIYDCPQVGGEYYLAFADVTNAKHCLKDVKKLLFREDPSILDAHVYLNMFLPESTSYCFILSTAQCKLLKNKLRQNAPSHKPQGDFFIKTIRADDLCYINKFLAELEDPAVRYIKRIKIKGNYLVDGQDIKKRNAGYPGDYPVKKPQYTKEEKANYTKAQSASLGFGDYYPPAFGFGKREVLVGFLFHENQVLKTNCLWIYDGGTVKRPNEFDVLGETVEFRNQKIGNKLYSLDRYDEYKNKIKDGVKNKEYNEPIVRFKCNDEKTVFISTDNLESRLLAKQYAIAASTASRKTPVCFYTPDKPEIIFREYTDAEYKFDCNEAKRISQDENLCANKYNENRFEFYLGLSAEDTLLALKVNKIVIVKSDEEIILPLPIFLLQRGYVHIFRFMANKTAYIESSEFERQLSRYIYNQDVMASILYYVLRADDKELAERIYAEIDFSKFRFRMKDDMPSPLIAAVENNNTKFVKLLFEKPLNHLWINIDTIDEFRKDTALDIAILNGNEEIVKILIDAGAKKGSALKIAIKTGRLNIVKILLNKNELTSPITDRSGLVDKSYPLIVAALFGKADIISYLIEQQACVDVRASEPSLNIDMAAIHFAVLLGYVDVVRVLINAGANLKLISRSKKDENTSLILHAAVKSNHLAMVKLIFEIDPTLLNLQDQNGYTPLMLAVKNKNLKIVEYLSKIPDIDFKAITTNGETLVDLAYQNQKINEIFLCLTKTAWIDSEVRMAGKIHPVHLFARHNEFDVLKELIKINPFLANLKNSLGCTPLLYSIMEGHKVIVDYFLKLQNDMSPRSSSYLAYRHKHPEIFSLLVNANTEENAVLVLDQYNKHPIHFAVEFEQLDSVKKLIECNPKLLNLQDGDNDTPLAVAVAKKNKEITEYLLHQTLKNTSEHDLFIYACEMKKFDLADYLLILDPQLINQKFAQEITPLVFAASSNNVEMIDYLLRKGVDINECDNDGRTALHYAAINNHIESIKVLVKVRPELIDIKDVGGGTALGRAYEMAHIDAVQCIFSLSPNIAGHTLFTYVCANGDFDFANMILQRDPQAVNNRFAEDGLTPLMYAVLDQKVDTVNYLLNHGADINAHCSDGNTALYLAVGSGNVDIVRVLLAANADKDAHCLNGGSPLILAKQLGKREIIHEIGKSELSKYLAKTRTRIQNNGGHHHNNTIDALCHKHLSFSLFSISAEEKLAAAQELENVIVNNADKAGLDSHTKALNDGELGVINRLLMA